MIELIGYIGSLLFAFCGLPQCIKCFREKNSDGLSWGFLFMWLGGELCLLYYTFFNIGLDIPLLMNYTINLLFLTVIFKYKIKPKKYVSSRTNC